MVHISDSNTGFTPSIRTINDLEGVENVDGSPSDITADYRRGVDTGAESKEGPGDITADYRRGLGLVELVEGDGGEIEADYRRGVDLETNGDGLSDEITADYKRSSIDADKEVEHGDIKADY